MHKNGYTNPIPVVGTGPSKGPDQHTNARSTNEIEPIAFPDTPDADENIADLLGQYRPALVDCHDTTQQLGNREHSDHCWNETDALQKLDTAEREPRVSGGRVDADTVDSKPYQQGCDAF